MIRIAVLEDTAGDRKKMLAHLEKFKTETGTTIEVTCFETGLLFLESGTGQYDIVLMDIEMPLMNGMEAARKMRETNQTSVLIFTTHVAQYALQGYEVDAMDYLLKPIGYFNLSLKLRKALQRLQQQQLLEQKITFVTQEGVRVMAVSTISHAEISGHQLTWHAESDYTIRGSMKNAEEQLKGQPFVKCSSSCIVNLQKVEGIEGDDVLIRAFDGIRRVALSRRMKKEFSAALMQHLSGGGRR